jgi:hypothetical protein
MSSYARLSGKAITACQSGRLGDAAAQHCAVADAATRRQDRRDFGSWFRLERSFALECGAAKRPPVGRQPLPLSTLPFPGWYTVGSIW